jgi:hypothetical protein
MIYCVFKVPVLLAHPDLLRIVPSARHNESAVAGQGKRIFRVVLEGINRTQPHGFLSKPAEVRRDLLLELRKFVLQPYGSP